MQNPSIITTSPSAFKGRKLISLIIDYWYWYIISLLICVSFAWFQVYYATPMYKVYAQIIVQDDKSSGSPLAGSSGGGFDFSSLFAKTSMPNEMAILQTSDLIKQAVSDLNLNIIYYHKGNIRKIELYKSCPFTISYFPREEYQPITMEIKFPQKNANKFTVKIGEQVVNGSFYDTLNLRQGKYYFTKNTGYFDPTASYVVSIRTPQVAADMISANLLTELLVQRGTILKLTYNTNLPKKGEEVLSAIIKAYTNRNLNEKNRISDSTIQFINSRIALVGQALANIESTIQQYKQSNKIANFNNQSQQLITRSATYYQQLNDLDVQLQVLNTMRAYVENEQNNSRPIPALLNNDATFSTIVNTYNAAQVQRDKLLLTIKENNPLTKNLDEQIKGLRGDMIRSLESQQNALKISRQQLQAQNGEVNELIRDVPEQERRFLDFSREQDVTQALYLFLLQKKEETAIAKASNVSNVSTIQAARASYTPYDPNKSIALTIGVLVGLVLPTGGILVRLMLSNRILTKEDITDITPATIISEIGHSDHDGLIDIEAEGRSVIAEQFRIFRTNMDFVLTTQSKITSPVFMVTSSISGEGKSFIAANLGQIYAISGKKVLLMELDLRKPKLSVMLNLKSDNGFSNYVISSAQIANFIKAVPATPNLFLLSSGPVPPNPAELLMSNKMSELIKELKNHFDIIIMDTAPIGAVTDAQILSKHADASLYIVRQRFSLRNSLEIVNDILLNDKIKSLYLVVNDVKAGTSYKYGYGYGYKYGYGYYLDSKKKRRGKKALH